MGFWDDLSDFWFGPGRRAAGNVLAGTAGMVPANSPVNSYEGMLKSMATGGGPSLAAQQYRDAMADTQNAAISMSRSGRPGSAEAGINAIGKAGQGLAAGAAEARTREQMAAINAGAGIEQQRLGMDQARMFANQQAYMQALGMLQNQGGVGQSLAGLMGQGLGAWAMLRRSKPQQPAQQPFNPGDMPSLFQPWNPGPSDSGSGVW